MKVIFLDAITLSGDNCTEPGFDCVICPEVAI